MEGARRPSLDSQQLPQCNSEEVEAQRWMDRASRYLADGRFESAIRLLDKTQSVFPRCKNLPELMAVSQVCYAATWRACHCARPHTRKLPDWYHVLKVDERADFDTIKKRYRQLALLLHPDKNKHVNSEAAFKIITEAYTCLSDQEKRDLFNLERRRSVCANCSSKAQVHAAGHSVQSAGHAPPRPVVVTRVRTPRTPKQSYAYSTPKSTPRNWDSDLRERAKSTVNNLEREFGTKTSKWMQQLASVRHRYWNLGNSSSPKPDPERRHTMSHSTTRMAGDFEARRASTGGVHDAKLEEDLDLLLKKLRAEGSASAANGAFFKEFVVQTRTPEAGHLARPLFVRRVARTSSVDRKCSLNDAGPTYSMCMPRGRCVSKPKDPSGVRIHSIPRKFSSSELKKHSIPKTESKERHYSKAGRSSSLRFDSTVHHQSTKEDGAQAVGRTASGSWTSRVKANPELFDDVFTTSSFRTPIRRQTTGSYTSEPFVLRTPPGCVTTRDVSPKVASLPSKLSQKMVAKERSLSPPVPQKNVTLASRLYHQSYDGESNEEARPLCGVSRSENVSSSFRMSSSFSVVERGRDLQLEVREQKQKTEAINGILERLRAEAKTVAASLDRLREDVAVENVTTRV